jgi:NADH:ubiquinone oxidoreductase subunit E
MDKNLRKIFDLYLNEKGIVIVVLQEIQALYGYLPEETLQEFANVYNLPLSEIMGVATFYSQFKFNKPGKHQIKVCHGTACHINGAVKISDTIEENLKIKPGETSEDGEFSLEDVACLGCCSLAPVVMVDDKVHGGLDNKKTKKILKSLT